MRNRFWKVALCLVLVWAAIVHLFGEVNVLFKEVRGFRNDIRDVRHLIRDRTVVYNVIEKGGQDAQRPVDKS